jgi:hypothetical protein
MLLGVWLLLRDPDRLRLSHVILGGICLGLSTLTRPPGLLIPAVILPYLWLSQRSFWRPVFRLIVVGVFMLLTLLPWVVRNYGIFNDFVLTTNGGANLWIGSLYESGNGGFLLDESLTAEELAQSGEINAMDELTQQDMFREWALENIREQPVSYFLYGFKKMREMYFFDIEGVALSFAELPAETEIPKPIRFATYASAQVYYMLVVILLGVSLVSYLTRLRQSKPGYLLLILLILYWTAIHFIYFGSGRFHYPILPIFAGLAATVLAQIFSPERGRQELLKDSAGQATEVA